MAPNNIVISPRFQAEPARVALEKPARCDKQHIQPDMKSSEAEERSKFIFWGTVPQGQTRDVDLELENLYSICTCQVLTCDCLRQEPLPDVSLFCSYPDVWDTKAP
ncbi:hypothetical protein HispidOSU_019345 [Sigmodon hispidus]